jgi:hypothetical protein
VTSEDDNSIDTDKCAIMARYETKNGKKYIKGDSKMEKGGQDADDNDFYFVAEDVDNGQIAIRNLKHNYYLEKAGKHIETKHNEETDCGDECHFILVDFSIATASSTSGNSINIALLLKIFEN